MGSVQRISAVSPTYKADAAVVSESKKPEPGAAGSGFTRAAAKVPSVDRSDDAATFQEKVQTLFDAKVPAGGPFSRSFEFNVRGVAGKIMEVGEGQLFIDFPQQGVGMLLKDGVCVPNNDASFLNIRAMQRATLLGLST